MNTDLVPSRDNRTPRRPLWRHAMRRWFIDRHVEGWLRELSPTASLRETRARVVRVVQETHDTRTFVLAPNTHWAGHRAGQHVTIAVEIDGVRTRRCYSLSSPPHAPHPSITVKRVPGGRVSTFLHDHIRVGSVLGLDRVAGDFVAPQTVDRPLLFIVGGSGVTPILSMLDDLSSRDALGDAVVLYHVRSADDIIGRARLASIEARHPDVRVHVLRDDDPRGPGRFDPDHVARLVPDAATREVYLCGPSGLMDAVQGWWDGLQPERPLHREAFALDVPVPTPGAAVNVTLRDGRTLTLSGQGTLLEQLEQAGLSPRHGCRMGICRTCTCLKVRGVVEDLRSGALSDMPGEDISPCVAVPRTDLELDLSLEKP